MAVSIGLLVVVAAGASIAAQYVHTGPRTTALEVFATATSAPGAGEGVSAGTQGGATGQPAIVAGQQERRVVRIELAFDKPSYTFTTPYPTITGSGKNVTVAQIVINDSNGAGLEKAEIAIKDGRWSYSSARALAPGTYAAYLGSEEGLVVKATIVIK